MSNESPRKRPNDPNPGLETCGRTTIQITDAGSVPYSTTNIRINYSIPIACSLDVSTVSGLACYWHDYPLTLRIAAWR